MLNVELGIRPHILSIFNTQHSTLNIQHSTLKNMKQLNWWKSIASFLVVLFTMPLGHALMMIMDKTMTPEAVHYSAFFMGLAGLIMVVIGVFVKGDTKQTLWGLFGGLLFWTGWIEFLFQYYATRWGTQPEMENGEVVTRLNTSSSLPPSACG